MHIKGKYNWIKHLDFMLIDLFALLSSFILAYYVKFKHFSIGVSWYRFVVIAILLNIIIVFVSNPYSGIFRRRYYREIGRCFLIVIANAFCSTLIFYALKIGADFSREVFLYTYFFYFFSSLVFKYIWKKLLTAGKVAFITSQKKSLVILSDKEKAEKDIQSIYSTDLLLYKIKGIYLMNSVDDELDSITFCENSKTIIVPVIKTDLVNYVLNNNVDVVLVATKQAISLSDTLKELIANGINVNINVDALLGFQTEEQFVTNIGINKALSVGAFSFSPSQASYFVVKRFFDIICGMIGLLILIPVSLIIKIAYLSSGDNASIVYRQKRVGLNGKLIRIWKFRSMVSNADDVLEELLKNETYRKEWEENQKFENDPRITKIGKVLRKTSIDELPQLVNVLMGDMSLVGPRPLVEGELESHNGLKLYEKVKPGITGWWGCNGRSNINYNERLELEYYYVKNCSLYLDILCIVRTIFAVIKKDGAK